MTPSRLMNSCTCMAPTSSPPGPMLPYGRRRRRPYGNIGPGGEEVGAIHVHEFISLDGVIDTPVWTFDYGFDPKMGETISAVTGRSQGILLGRTTYEMFEPA